MLNLKRKLAPVQRKPRMAKTITKKMRKPRTGVGMGMGMSKMRMHIEDKGWSNSHIEQSYT